ncbi:MAG: terminase family protein [Puniceicoccales bacterium]|jgi:hypothetical protein|nr:terminase family protein [Puniceicoccales bacterium]
MPIEHIQPSHPVMGLTQEQYLKIYRERGGPETDDLVRRLNAAILLERSDPYRGCYVPWYWREVEEALMSETSVTIFGGNRSGKSTFAARAVVRVLVEGPPWQDEETRARRPPMVACFHANEKSSRLQQQKLIHYFLPREWKGLSSDRKTGAKVNYTPTNGFTDNIITLPNGAQCLFFFYNQKEDVLEGFEFDLVWMDELFTVPWMEAADFRVSTRRGRVLKTYTPITGYSAAVNADIAGGVVVRSAPLDERVWADRRDAQGRPPVLAPDAVYLPEEGCAGAGDGEGAIVLRDCGERGGGVPRGEVPVKMRCRKARSVAFWYLTQWNAYNPFGEILDKVSDKPLEQRLIRTAGWATRTEGGVFGKYGPAHIVSVQRWREVVSKGGGLRYCVTDPGNAKNWVIKWYLLTPQNHIVLYREWPDVETYGEWAVPADGASGGAAFRAGPAQKTGRGRGILDYKRIVMEAEGWRWDEARGEWDGSAAEKIELRLIDPRFGAMEVPSDRQESTSIIELMSDEQRDGKGRVVGPRMEWEPAPAGAARDGTTPVGVGVQMLCEKMSWDDSQPMSVLNCPKWYVVESCRQSDLAYREYTGSAGALDPLKDLVDPDRYLLFFNPEWYEAQAMEVRGGGAVH